ncbi:MAG: RIO1 family regulatory kinase/ATPase [Clostridia bacterium]
MDFISRKNKVTLEDGVVIKDYDKGNFLVELQILSKLKGVLPCPNVVDFDENQIVMNYVDGALLADYLEQAEREYNVKKASVAFEMLLNYLKKFYKITGFIYGDVNFKNFIVNTQLVGIDFEDAKVGVIKDELSEVLAFYLTYSPAFSIFKKEIYAVLLNQIKNIFAISIQNNDVAQQVKLIELRRKTTYSNNFLLI